MERKGLVVAGTVLVDKINEISAFPECGELTQITSIEKAVGGCVPNVAIDLKKISPETPVFALGKIGDDEEGEFLKSVLLDEKVDVTGLVATNKDKTSFTDVMSVKGGQRTFFTYAGASADFGADDIDFDNMSAKILHLGYFLLLNKVDNGEGLEILKKAKAKGIKTSIDLVSENSDRYSLVLPCLQYTDYLIINELEAGKLAGIEPLDENLEAIARKLKDLGVKEKVVIHKFDRAVCLSDEGYTVMAAYDVPKSYIKGKTGAGDAFCAGTLIGIYNGMSDEEMLDLASASAIMALGSTDATSGLKTAKEAMDFCSTLGRMPI